MRRFLFLFAVFLVVCIPLICQGTELTTASGKSAQMMLAAEPCMECHTSPGIGIHTEIVQTDIGSCHVEVSAQPIEIVSFYQATATNLSTAECLSNQPMITAAVITEVETIVICDNSASAAMSGIRSERITEPRYNVIKPMTMPQAFNRRTISIPV